jgi:hypothetical protein
VLRSFVRDCFYVGEMKHRSAIAPWTEHVGDLCHYIMDSQGYPVASVLERRDQEPNAKLIAAAPDLLAALEYALEASWDGINDPVWAESARRAVKKARE